ncbi:unnamed protein product [Tilletia controversa]|nr:unnamed protein product [Tilletia controversa]
MTVTSYGLADLYSSQASAGTGAGASQEAAATGTGDETTTPSRKRARNASDDDEDVPFREDLPSKMALWVKENGLSLAGIEELLEYVKKTYELEENKACPQHLLLAYGQSLLSVQLSRRVEADMNLANVESESAVKRAQGTLERIEKTVESLQKKVEKLQQELRPILSASETAAIGHAAAFAFFSHAAQGYSKDSSISNVVSDYIDRHPSRIGETFASRVKEGGYKIRAEVTAVIKRKITQLRAHTRDQLHWSLGVDKNKEKLSLYKLYKSLTGTQGVPVTQDRIMRLAYLRSIALATHPRQIDGNPTPDWWAIVDASLEATLKESATDRIRGMKKIFDGDKKKFGGFEIQPTPGVSMADENELAASFKAVTIIGGSATNIGQSTTK